MSMPSDPNPYPDPGPPPYPPHHYAAPRRTNGLAIAAMVLGIVWTTGSAASSR